MAENQNQPKEYDAVLGTQNSAPIGSVILGGLEGVKNRLRNVDIEARIAALKEALNYGEAGLDLVIQAWQYESGKFKWAAYSLIRHSEEARVKQALQEYNPWLNITCLHTLQQNTLITVVAISPDGRTLVSAGRDINLWDLHTGQLQPISMADFNVNSLVISQDGKTLVSRGGTYDGDHKIKVWDLQSGERKQTLEESTYRVFSLIISPDGKTLACGSENNGINVWDLQTGAQEDILTFATYANEFESPARIRLFPMSGGIDSFAISPDGHLLACRITYQRMILVCDLQTRQQLRTLQRPHHGNHSHCLAITPNKQIFVDANDSNRIDIWNLETGELMRTLEAHYQPVLSIAISPDGETLVSGDNNSIIKVWSLPTGEEKFTINAQSGSILCVAISPDGQNLIGSCGDGTIKVWDLKTGQGKAICNRHAGAVRSVDISPDGQTLVSGSVDGTIKIWGLPSG